MSRQTDGNGPLRECSWDLDTLVAYTMGRLPVDEAEAFTRHLEDCGVCRHSVREILSRSQESIRRFFGEQVAGDDPPPLPDDLKKRISRKEWGNRLKALRNDLGILAHRTVTDLAEIMRTIFATGIPESRVPAVRSGAATIRMEFINLSSVYLNEGLLHLEKEKNRWRFTGFDPEFKDCTGFLVLLPVDRLEEHLPEWRTPDAGKQLERLIRKGEIKPDYTGTAVVEGRFSGSDTEADLEFFINPDLNDMIRNPERCFPVIIVLPGMDGRMDFGK